VFSEPSIAFQKQPCDIPLERHWKPEIEMIISFWISSALHLATGSWERSSWLCDWPELGTNLSCWSNISQYRIEFNSLVLRIFQRFSRKKSCIGANSNNLPWNNSIKRRVAIWASHTVILDKRLLKTQSGFQKRPIGWVIQGPAKHRRRSP